MPIDAQTIDAETIADGVRAVLVEEFEIEPSRIGDAANLFEDLGLDSLDAVDLIVSLEQAFGGRVPEEQAKTIRTVGDVNRLIATHLGKG